MKLPRFTVRRLMVAVAIVGLTLGFEVIRRRRVAFLEIARLNDNTASVLRSELSESDEPGPHGDPITMRRLADYCDAMRKKYELAARYPWLPVEPDPPEPQ
jgi:hypothetical protein